MGGSNNQSFELSPEIIAALPQPCKVLSTVSYGASSWSNSMRITIEDGGKKTRGFFLKWTPAAGKPQQEGEFRAMTELYKAMPDIIPRPNVCAEVKGKFDSTYVLLYDYVHISSRLPDPKLLGEEVAKLHRKTQGNVAQFGFYVNTFDGKFPQNTGWDPNWPSFFRKLLKGILDVDIRVNGPWKELEDVAQRIFDCVIPRLLTGLTQEGEPIKPTLIHGNLWEGNMGADVETGKIYIFDAVSFYAHNEMEMGMWRVLHHRMNDKVYREEYLRHMKPSEPIKEWDDRIRLYSVKTKLMFSAHSPSNSHVRQQAYDDLLYLVRKYAPAEEPQ